MYLYYIGNSFISLGKHSYSGVPVKLYKAIKGWLVPSQETAYINYELKSVMFEVGLS